jgi:3-dehydrosphinganine reductase
VNNAGWCKPGMFLDVDAEKNAKENMDLNYYGAVKMV